MPAIVAQPVAAEKIVRISLFATDLDGAPLSTIDVGSKFLLQAVAQDLRAQDGISKGVYAAYVNVSYDASLAYISSEAQIAFDPSFRLLRSFDARTPGELRDAGAATTSFSPPGSAPQKMWSMAVTAGNIPGEATFTPSFDEVMGHDVLLYGIDVAIASEEIEFVGATISIASAATTSRDAALPERSAAEPSSSAISAPLASFLENLAITTDPGVQQMPSVAVDPHDSRHVVVAHMDYSRLTTGYASIGVSVSRDGGVQWQHTSIDLPQGFSEAAANPIVKFDDQGRLFVSFMSATFKGGKPPIANPGGGPLRALGHESNNGIFVSRSDDGGENWQPAVAVTSHVYKDQKVPFEIIPDLAIDTFKFLPDRVTPNPNYGNLYEVWSRYYPPGQYPGEPDSTAGSNIMIAVSRDGGRTWQEQRESHRDASPDPVTVIYNKDVFYGTELPAGQGLENWAHVTVGPEGDVYVSQFRGGQFVVHHSTDGARSFQHPDPLTSALFPFGVNAAPFPSPLSSNNFRLQVVRAIVADPARPGHVYVLEANTMLDAQGIVRDQGDIIFARSTDYGATWQTTFSGSSGLANLINDDNDGRSANGSGEVASAQALPRLAIDEQGNLAVTWYDTRHDPANHRLDVYGAISTDGGRSFGPNFRLTDQSFDANAGAFQDATGGTSYYLGDFLGLAMSGGTVYASWTDTRNGQQDVFFSRVSRRPLTHRKIDLNPTTPRTRLRTSDATS